MYQRAMLFIIAPNPGIGGPKAMKGGTIAYALPVAF
jgi:hypothetical protein